MTYNICQNILLAAIFRFQINGNDLFLNPIVLFRMADTMTS